MTLPLLAALALVAPQALSDSLLMRFAPPLGSRITRDFQYSSHLRVDSAGVVRSEETAAVGRMRQVVAPGRGGATVLHLALDSLHVRDRLGDAPWSEDAVAEPSATWRQLEVNEWLETRRSRGGGYGSVGALMEWAALGLRRLALPHGPNAAGDTWRMWVSVPRGRMTLPQGLQIDLDVRVVVRLDSIVVTGLDTLFHTSVTGERWDARGRTIAPSRLGVAGSLIWSSGWHAYVHQAVRIAITSEGRAPGGEPVGVTLDMTMRSQIRPIS